MIDGYPSNMRVSNEVNDDKHRAPRPLEEAAETFGARQARYDMRFASRDACGAFRRDLIDECVDTVQAAANPLAATSATRGEVDAAIKRMDRRNENRGGLQ